MQAAIIVVDFGSQYSQLIVRQLRSMGFYAQLLPPHLVAAEIKTAQALVLSGGPRSVFDDTTDFNLFFSNPALPVLGICYGMQIMAHVHGGKVQRGKQAEYGKTVINATGEHFSFLKDHPHAPHVWMSHFDEVVSIPQDLFEVTLTTQHQMIAGIQHLKYPWMAYQFHPEVLHGDFGPQWLQYFLFEVAKLIPPWNKESLLQTVKNQVIEQMNTMPPNQGVLCAFSGGVDSLVAAKVVQEILGKRLHCVFVNHGLLRPQDLRHIEELQAESGLPITVVDSSSLFLNALKGITDPEKKRQLIGHLFIDVFKDWIQQQKTLFPQRPMGCLLQGTLYPDVIESQSHHGESGLSHTIKSHHNVGGLPKDLGLELLEPFRLLFKDEVRALGAALGLPHSWLHRAPFPGPGLAIRIMGEVTPERLKRLQQADDILWQELSAFNLMNQCWQYGVVYLPIKTVGVKGDERVYEEVLCLRLIDSLDGMTAKICEFPFQFFTHVAQRMTNEIRGITRVVYDLTSKPPATIEWE